MRCAAVSTGAHSCPYDTGGVSAFFLLDGHALELGGCAHRTFQTYTAAKDDVKLIFLWCQTVAFVHVIAVVFYETPGVIDTVVYYRNA